MSIFTIQCGHYSSFVGTHFWNLQAEAYDKNASTLQDPNTLFRASAKKWYPRVLIYDLKGANGSMRLQPEGLKPFSTRMFSNQIQTQSRSSSSSSSSSEEKKITPKEKAEEGWRPTWGGTIEEIEVEAFPQTTYQKMLNGKLESVPESKVQRKETQREEGEKEPLIVKTVDETLEEEIKVWSDFLRPEIHTKSIYEIASFHHGVDNFDQWVHADLAFGGYETDEISDRIRYFVEECDRLEGYQILADIDNGFGGFSSKIVEMLRDDFSNKAPILTFGFNDQLLANIQEYEFPKVHINNRILNSALAVETLSRLSSSFVPVLSSTWNAESFSSFNNFKRNLPYHSSAICAAAIDTITLPFRTKKTSMLEFCNFTTYNTKMSALSVSLSLDVRDVIDKRSQPFYSGSPFDPLLFCPTRKPPVCFSQLCVTRGISDDLVSKVLRDHLSSINSVDPTLRPFHSIDNVTELMDTYLRQNQCSSIIVPTESPMYRPMSFPNWKRKTSAALANAPDFVSTVGAPVANMGSFEGGSRLISQRMMDQKQSLTEQPEEDELYTSAHMASGTLLRPFVHSLATQFTDILNTQRHQSFLGYEDSSNSYRCSADELSEVRDNLSSLADDFEV